MQDRLLGDVMWSVFENMSQSNSRFNALDKIVSVHSVKMTVGFGRGNKIVGRPLSVMANLKRSIVEIKAAQYHVSG